MDIAFEDLQTANHFENTVYKGKSVFAEKLTCT